MPKRKCHFSDNFTKEWSFVKRGRNEYEAHCTICNIYISVSHSGKTSIHEHIKSNSHTSKLSAASSSRDISSFMVKENTQEDILVCAAELTTAYKVVNHHQSFNSLDCNTKLNATLYPDSKIASKQSTARTKATAIINNILAPHSVQKAKEEMENVPFYGILTDSSNHNAEKIFPLLIQYFSEKEGLQLKLMKLESLENETSDTIVTYCINTLENLNISLEKLTAFSADNTNTNFGGRERQGTNNVFFKLQTKLSKNIEGIGCPAHILHNTASTAADVLTVDLESIVLKIYKYFSIFTVRNERLKSFCTEVEVTHSNLLSHSRTRWLSLLPAIERVLKLWEPLKDFFLAETRPPKVIIDFFQNQLSLVYLLFLHSQSFLFEKQIKKIEKSNITIVEVKGHINSLEKILKERKEAKFLGIQTKIEYDKMKNDAQYSNSIKLFDEEIDNYYRTALEYLEQWSRPLIKFEIFSWMNLTAPPQWQDVEKTIIYLQEKGLVITDSCFEEILYLQNFMEKRKDNEVWTKKDMHDKWLNLFHDTEELERKRNLLLICQYLFAIPGHNANVERIFSLVVAQWTKERNRLHIETVESIIQCKFNFKMTCSEFHKYIMGKPELLKQVKKTEKYKNS